ncbi:MAG TPA: tRNA preQ1(34) S-adenosylmethionine ribosyltransferase-isomerase QueA [Longimicrobiales bacterium]|nr:tRNA preQ1(34) S-adenosylmethionine ribosyltransferase-isomerase QueA [Longimicrobiales bacterium]
MNAGRYTTSSFDYELPDALIARYPAEVRDASRLLVLDRASDTLAHRHFADIIDYIEAGDALVLNETRVIPARLLGTRPSGAPAEVMLLQPVGAEETTWSALVRPGARLRPGSMVNIADDLSVEVLDVLPDGARVVRLVTELPVRDALERHGHMPLPPYIGRADEPGDRERYQTVYARAEGSVAAPTAGLHFTPQLLDALEAKGVRLVRLVLHVGAGTFRPVDVEDPNQHPMHAERYEVSDDAASAINAARAAGGRVWAVGTTVTRTLESVADERGCVRSGSGETRLFIRPGYSFRAVDRLITNFHLPRSTLLMLVAAFGGYERIMQAYRVAVAERYRFYSYGDAMAIL